MSEVNKIANYNQMMSWLTRPSVPKTETREDFAIGGGVIQGEDLGTREGFAGPKLIKIGKDKGNYIVRYRDKKFGRREGQTGFNEGNTDPMTKKEADAFYEDLLSKKEAKKASGLKSKNIKVKNQAQQINTFVSNFIDQNLGKYGIKDYDKFEKELNETFEQSGIEDAGNRKSKYKGFPNIATAESEVPFSKFDIGTINRSAETDTTGNYFKKLFYTGKLKTDDNFRNRVERYLDYNNTDKKFYGDGNPIDREALKNKYADVLNDSAEPKEDIRFLLENKDVGEGKFRSGIIRQFFPEKADIYIKKKATSSASYTKDVATIENFLSNKQVKDTLNGYPSIKSFMKGQSDQLKKIFDASELPDNLNFNTDHVEGIAEIAKLDNPDDVMRGLRNLIGMTQERNRNLGWKGYSKKRRELTDKINGGIDPQKNLDELNKITSKSYPEVKNKKAYSLKNGVLSVTDNFKFLSNPETTYKQYFTELTSTKEGLNALKIQYKTNEDLKKLLLEDPNLRKNVVIDDLTETIPGVTTADKLGKPPATVEREMFEKANNRFSPETIKKDLTNVQKVFRKMQGQLNSGMDPKLLAEYLGAEVKDIAAFGKKYGGDALKKITSVPIKGLAGIDLPVFQAMFAATYDLEQDSPVWLTFPMAFTDEVSNVFKLYDKSTGKYGLGKIKDFGKFLASSLVPQKILGKAIRNPLFKAATKVGRAGSFAAPILEVGKQAYLSEKRKGMLPDIARQFDIPIEEARKGYDNYVRQGQIRGMQSMVDDTEIPEMSQQGEDNLNSKINAFKQFGALFGLNENPLAEKESIYTRGKENPMSLDRALYPNRQNFADGPKDPSKKGLGSLNKRQFLKMLALIPAGILAIRGGPNLLKKTEKATEIIKRGADGVPDFLMDLIAKVKLKAETTGLKYFTGNKPEEFKDVYQADNFIVTEKGNKTIIREIDDPDRPGYRENQMEIDYDPESGGYTYNEASARPDSDGKLKDVDEYIEDDDLENMRKYTYDK